MAEVTIPGTTGTVYDVYISLAEADAYLEAQISATTWQGLTDSADDVDQKERAIVSATRFIDRQLWQGEKTDPYQLHAFPRTGLTYPDSGDDVPSDAVPQEVLDATAELASLLLDGSDVQSNTDPGTNLVQSLKAGSVAISYFRGESLLSRLPTILDELLGFWLAGNAIAVSTTSYGTDRESQFEDQYDFNQGI